MQSTSLPKNILHEFKGIVGEKNLLFREVDLLLYSYDSAIDRAIPSAVLFPETSQQISSLVKICYKNKIPFVARGAGTNLCGAAIPLRHAVVIAPTRMRRILSIDAQKRIAIVEPGTPNLFLKKALEPYNLFYPPDPASQKACTIGGNIGTNAGGPHCLKYGVTSHHVLAIEAVLPDGEMAEFNILQSGYDLTGLFVGSEGTLGIVTRATLNLVPIPQQVETMLVSFLTLESAIQTVTEIISCGIVPATLEAMDKMTVQAVEAFVHAGYPLDAEAVLLIEVDGNQEVKSQVEEIREICKKNGCSEFRLAKNEREREKLWEGRRGSYPAMARLAPNVLVEDGAVPRNKLPEALKKIRNIARENGLSVSLIFHAGDGNLHPQILFDERDAEQTRKVKSAGYQMLKACVELGGTISGEHGIGMDKRDAMLWLFSSETLALFRRIKEVFDPENLCNPDKLIPLPPQEEESVKNYNSGHSRSPLPILCKEGLGEERSGEKGSIMSAYNAMEQVSIESEGKGITIEPKSEEELSSILQGNFPSKKGLQNPKKIYIQGTKSRIQSPPSAELTLVTASLNQMVEHDVENFTVTVQSGMKVDDLRERLLQKKQKVFLPPFGTIGGTVASNPMQFPRIRDQILGMKIALYDGRIVEFGAKVMKNVAGYDAAKLLLGSWGTLAVIVSVTLKTFPQKYGIDSNWGAALLNSDAKAETGIFRIRQKIKTAFDPENIFLSLMDFSV